MNDIGFRIKSIRKANNLNQSEFAKSIGISQGNLSEIEMGNSNPSAETLISIKKQYSIDTNWLLNGHEDSESGFTYENDNERKLVTEYRSLCEYDKVEILKIIQLKLELRGQR